MYSLLGKAFTGAKQDQMKKALRSSVAKVDKALACKLNPT